MFFLICASVGYYGIINIQNEQNVAKEVNATPISNKTIVIDAGHGLPDEGAIGC